MSTVVLDTITGKSTATTITIGSTPVVSASANSMTIRGEGSNQTSIQQGLCKAWINLNGTGTIATRDSFNVSSIADQATGDTRVTVSSAFATTNYCTTASGGENADSYSGGLRAGSCYMVSTTVAGVAMSFQNGGATDCVINCSHITGDLA
jgi:hypothetical protein